MPIKLPIDDCTGCSACFSICPTHAISMQENKKGFLHPSISRKLCIECRRCQKVCPATQDIQFVKKKTLVFAAKTLDVNVHKTSQSGGIFFELAKKIIMNGGVVYGAALNEKFETQHVRISCKEDLCSLQGTKYVQSVIGESFASVRKDLSEGATVLYSGTPCQIAGLYAFLDAQKVAREQLITCDLICYGVPSPGVFRQWKEVLHKKYRSSLVQMSFRQTDTMEGGHGESYHFENGKILNGNYYTNLYFRNLILRESCVNCKYCVENRVSDITLGDYWGIKETHPQFYDEKGVSFVMINTNCGKTLFDSIKNNLLFIEGDLDSAKKNQPRLNGLCASHSQYSEKFWENYFRFGMEYIACDEGYISPTFKYRLQLKFKHLLRF